MNEGLYQIHWRNLTNGRSGVGPKQLPEAEARKLADDLNEEHPDFEHQALPVGSVPQFKSAPTKLEVASAPRNFVPMIDSDACPIAGKHLGWRMSNVPAD